MKKLIAIGIFVVVVWIIFGSLRNGADAAGGFLDDAMTFGYFNRQAPVLREISGAERDVQSMLAGDINASRTPTIDRTIVKDFDSGRTFYNLFTTNAGKSYDVHIAAETVLAQTQGIVMSSKPDQVVEADNPDWQRVQCRNIGTNRIEPCKLFPGDQMEAWDSIKSGFVLDADTRENIPIGPLGINESHPRRKPFENSLPRFSLIGRLVYPNGTFSDTFLVGELHDFRSESGLDLKVNADYRDASGRTHDEWYDKNFGSFKVRIRRQNYTQQEKEEPQPQGHPEEDGRLYVYHRQ